MKSIFALALVLFAFTVSFAQNEQSPIVEKDINYQDWTYKSIRTGEDVNLRNSIAGSRLAIVVYFAPWCPNWRHDAPMLERFYEKYKGNGLDIIAVGEYDPVDSMKTNLEALKITFPAVYESGLRTDKQKTEHFKYRTSTGDTRGWGSPWYIFLEPAVIEKEGETVTKRTHVINGEMIEAEGEKFIRERLGLPAGDSKNALTESKKVEPCDPDKPAATVLKKP